MGGLSALCQAINLGWVRPQASQIDYVWWDQGAMLYCASHLLAGDLLYRDFYFNYGPVPLVGFSLVAKLFGISPFSFELHKILIDALAVMAACWLFLKHLPRWAALTGLLLTQFCFLTGGTFLPGSYEKLGLILIVLTWNPPGGRSARNAFWVGLLLGALQGVKFGSCFVAGLVVLLLDVSAWIMAGGLRQQWWGWLRNLGIIFAGYALFQTFWVSLAFSLMPSGYAWDAVFPKYMLDWYASYVGPAHRWPGFCNWNYFISYQLVLVAGVLFGIGYLVRSLLGRLSASTNVQWAMGSPEITSLRFIFFPIFYLIGCLIYFKHSSNIMVYGWLTVMAMPFWLVVARGVWRIGLILMLIPCACVLPVHLSRNLLRPMPANLVRHVMPNGGALYLTKEEAAEFDGLISRLKQIDQETPQKRGFVVIPLGYGVGFWGQIPLASRHHWFYPAVVQPYESEQVWQEFAHAKAIVLILAGPGDFFGYPRGLLENGTWLPFDTTRQRELLNRFGKPIWFEGRFVIYN